MVSSWRKRRWLSVAVILVSSISEGLNNPSFRRRPESMPLNFWIPAFAGMTKLGLIGFPIRHCLNPQRRNDFPLRAIARPGRRLLWQVPEVEVDVGRRDRHARRR